MKKKKKAYISANLTNRDLIAINIPGEKRQVYSLQTAYRKLEKVARQSRVLSNQYLSNVKFPSGLGLSTDNILLGGIDKILFRVANRWDIDEISPYGLKEGLQHLWEISKNKASFQNAYYDYLRSYYGVNYSNKRMQQLLKKGAFKYVPGDDTTNWDESDATRILEWIIENMEYRSHAPASKIRKAGESASFESILEAMQAVSHGDTTYALYLLNINKTERHSEYDAAKVKQQQEKIK